MAGIVWLGNRVSDGKGNVGKWRSSGVFGVLDVMDSEYLGIWKFRIQKFRISLHKKFRKTVFLLVKAIKFDNELIEDSKEIFVFLQKLNFRVKRRYQNHF